MRKTPSGRIEIRRIQILVDASENIFIHWKVSQYQNGYYIPYSIDNK